MHREQNGISHWVLCKCEPTQTNTLGIRRDGAEPAEKKTCPNRESLLSKLKFKPKIEKFELNLLQRAYVIFYLFFYLTRQSSLNIFVVEDSLHISSFFFNFDFLT